MSIYILCLYNVKAWLQVLCSLFNVVLLYLYLFCTICDLLSIIDKFADFVWDIASRWDYWIQVLQVFFVAKF